MKIVIEVGCDNAAFDGCLFQELQRILNTVPEKVEAMFDRDVSANELRDIDGNTVGSIRVLGKVKI